jgi:nucleotide-binding universal stress UspA family protein
MTRRILLPLEHGDDATSAVELARWMALRRKAELLLLRVEEWPVSGSFGFGWTAPWRAGQLKELKTALEGPEGVSATILSDDALPAASILKQAQLRGASLIIVPFRHERALLRVLSVHPADRVLREATLPVLAVPAAGARRVPAVSRVLYAYENGPEAVLGLRHAIDFAQMFDASVVLQRLRTATPPEPLLPRKRAEPRGEQETKSLEGRLLWILKRREVPSQVLPPADEPPRDLVPALAQNGIDLVLLTRTRNSGKAPLSLARHVLQEARVPVLLTREESPLSTLHEAGSRLRIGI